MDDTEVELKSLNLGGKLKPINEEFYNTEHIEFAGMLFVILDE
jgi:hypothetical protein